MGGWGGVGWGGGKGGGGKNEKGPRHTVDGQNPFRAIMVETITLVGIYRGSYHSRVSQVVQDFVHPQKLGGVK